MQNQIVKYVIQLEFLIISVALILFGLLVGKFEWYWLLLGFLAYDITLLGYLVSPAFGRYAYNITHSLAGPALLAVVYILTNDQAVLFVTVTWLLNISINRALGFGLKESSGVEYTHLGKATLHRKIVRGK